MTKQRKNRTVAFGPPEPPLLPHDELQEDSKYYAYRNANLDQFVLDDDAVYGEDGALSEREKS